GLVIWKNTLLPPETNKNPFGGKFITALFKDSNGTMWVGVRGAGIFHHENGKYILLPDPSAERLLQDTHCLLVDHQGRVWMGAGDDRVLCRDGEQWLRYRIPHHLARPYISALAESPDGTVWAGSVSEGLFEFNQGKFTPINAGSGLADNVIESLLMDKEGRLWVGTDAGLSRLRPKILLALEQNEGLDYGPVQGLAEVAPGIIWAGKPDGGLYKYDGRMFSRLGASALLGDEPQVNALLLARDGSCWVGGAHGVLHFQDPAREKEAGPPSLVGQDVISLAQDADGGIWAGTRAGQLWLSHSGKWAAQKTYWQGHAVTAMVQDRDGWMWIGTEGDGLHRIKGNAHMTFDKNGGGLESDLIRTLYLDAEGTLWIGTAGGGLSRYMSDYIRTFTTREGLPDNTISQILEDDAGKLWLGCDRGIASVSKHDLAELALDKIHSVYPQVYGRADGMLSEECTGGFYPAGLKTKSGLLWFSTLKGIVVADPKRIAEGPAPTVLLEEVLLDGEPIPSFPAPMLAQLPGKNGLNGMDARTLTMPPGKHRLELRYTGLSFNAPERIRFRYKLEPLDADWVEAADAGTRRTASYSYVPPGEYRFRVIACNSDGIWNEHGAGLSMKVLPHFWQTWWFIGCASLLLLMSVGGTVRFVEKAKIQRRLKHLEQERVVQRERARIARDLHDDLGSSLTRISLLTGLARADKENPALVEAHSVKLAQSALQTVRALEEIVWAVRPGSDSLQSLLEYIAHFANELFEGDTARCRLVMPAQVPQRPLPPELRHDIFLIVKEALTNALKHASAREVRVQAKFADDLLEILVQDDGQGFDPNAPRNSSVRNGLGNMRRRAEGVGGTLDIQSWPGKGTAVCLTVKLPASFEA
ncbi:MAG TPA: two-component regulator propeller domain-containing protein, partial [Verrucomicrobiae bacterium]|nr:two-component regulator propeller domain-containing protein [Verrucomicrobiae bacterium]